MRTLTVEQAMQMVVDSMGEMPEQERWQLYSMMQLAAIQFCHFTKDGTVTLIRSNRSSGDIICDLEQQRKLADAQRKRIA